MRLFRVHAKKRRPDWLVVKDRHDYQSRYVKFDIKGGDRVLDIGSGQTHFLIPLCVSRGTSRTQSTGKIV